MPPKKRYQVRVLSGSLRGRMLAYPAERSLRPTMQRTKAALFDALSPYLERAVFVDLFAGAGGIGIEALSRGASVVHFVEQSRVAIRYLRANLEACAIGPASYRVHAGDVMAFLERRELVTIAPDIVFADPPYGAGDASLLLELIRKIHYSAPDLIVLEHDTNVTLDAAIAGLERTRYRTFGQTSVSFFAPAEGEDP